MYSSNKSTNQDQSQARNSSSFRNQSSTGHGTNSSSQSQSQTRYPSQTESSSSFRNQSSTGHGTNFSSQNQSQTRYPSQTGSSSSFRNQSSTGHGTNSSVSGSGQPSSQIYDEQRSRSISRLNTNADADGSQRSVRPQSSMGRSVESSQSQNQTRYPSQTGSSSSFRNQSSTGHGTNSSVSGSGQPSSQIYDEQRSRSISRLNTNANGSQRSHRPQSSTGRNVESSQTRYPSQTGSSSSFRNPSNSSTSVQEPHNMSDYDRSQRISTDGHSHQRSNQSQSMGRSGESERFVPNSEYSSSQRSQPVSNSAYASRGGESTNYGRSAGAYENGPSATIDSDDDYSQSIQPRTRREVQKSYLQQQREREQQRRNQSNQPAESAGQNYAYNSPPNVQENGNPGSYPYANEEAAQHCQQEQQHQQCERVAAFTVRTRQVYCIPKNPPLAPNQNCQRFRIVPESSPCQSDRNCCFSWAHICVCPIRCLLFTLLLLLCFLLFFAAINLFRVFLDKWDAYNSKHCGSHCHYHDNDHHLH